MKHIDSLFSSSNRVRKENDNKFNLFYECSKEIITNRNISSRGERQTGYMSSDGIKEEESGFEVVAQCSFLGFSFL